MPLLRLPHIPYLSVDAEARSGGKQAIQTGRSWWAVRYTDGRIIHEWDPDAGSPNKHADWTRIDRRRRQYVRLFCPNGKMVQLGDDRDATGKLFQFKVGQRNVRFMPGPDVIEDRQVFAHVVGIIHGFNGECTLFSWETLPPPEPPSDAPPMPSRQAFIDKSADPGMFETAYAQWERDFDDFCRTQSYKQFARRFQLWELSGRGQLTGPVEDNVYTMQYHNQGRLAADYLGIDDGDGR